MSQSLIRQYTDSGITDIEKVLRNKAFNERISKELKHYTELIETSIITPKGKRSRRTPLRRMYEDGLLSEKAFMTELIAVLHKQSKQPSEIRGLIESISSVALLAALSKSETKK